MRRRRLPLVPALAVAILLACQLPALAQAAGVTQEVPATAWFQPNYPAGVFDGYDGVGTWLYTPPTATSTYEYTLEFNFKNLRQGAITVAPGSIHAIGRLSLFEVTPGFRTSTEIRFDWYPGQFSFLYVHHLTGNDYGGWIMDWDAGTWTYIGSVTAPAGWGSLLGATGTSVSWSPTAGARVTCAGYPSTDGYFYPPLEYTGSVFTVAEPHNSNLRKTGDCPTQTEILANGWVHYHLGS